MKCSRLGHQSRQAEIPIRHTGPQTLCQNAHQSQRVPLPSHTQFRSFPRHSQESDSDTLQVAQQTHEMGVCRKALLTLKNPHTPAVMGTKTGNIL